MNTFKIMESEKDDKGDVHNNIVFILWFFSYVPFIAKLVLQAGLHLMHLIIFFFSCFFLMCQFIKLLLQFLPLSCIKIFSCSHVFFLCHNLSQNYSCQHFHISCIQIFSCSYALFWCANSSPNYYCQHFHISCIKICSWSHVFFWCDNSLPNYSYQHFYISCIKIFSCSHIFFWYANSSPNYSCQHFHISCIKTC